jgi:Tfp pilus assembly protein PilV
MPGPDPSRSVWSAAACWRFRPQSACKSASKRAHSKRFATLAAFSLIEILVTVALMSAIILGLLLMFNQVQRAFRGSMVAKDVMEGGRNIMDMLGREIEQMTPSESRFTTNFFSEYSPSFHVPGQIPMRQSMPGMTNGWRTNMVERFFFLSKVNQDWYGTGYQVVPDSYSVGPGLPQMGTLYKFTTNYPISPPTTWPVDFVYATNPTMPNVSKLAEGVVHFRVTAYDVNGNPITPLTPQIMRNTRRDWDLSLPGKVKLYCTNNAVPAYVEVELGIIESQVLERWRSMAQLGSNPQLAYLSDHIAEVHLFRQRFPVRNVDFAAYQ